MDNFIGSLETVRSKKMLSFWIKEAVPDQSIEKKDTPNLSV